MNDSRFDLLTSELSRRIERRRLALGAGAGLAGLFASGFPSEIEAGKNKKKKRKKKRRKKKKKQMCKSAYGQKLRCKPNTCCDPATSTIAACTEIGFPTCCASSRMAYPAGTTCCNSYSEGLDGACPSDYPVCCPGTLGGGCCLPGTTCCDPADFGGELYCCPVGTTCDAVDWECTPNGAGAARQAATPLLRGGRTGMAAPESQSFSESVS
jgi:hypothetical protein